MGQEVLHLIKTQGLTVRDCGHEICEPAHSFGPAVREYFLLHVIRRGCGVFENGCGRHELKAGQGFMIFPNEITIYSADRLSPWEYDWVGYSGEKAAQWTDTLGLTPQNPVVSLGDCAEKVIGVIKDIYADSAALDNRESAAVGGLFRMFAWIMQSALPHRGKWASSACERYYQRAYWHMESNIQRDLQIADVAAFVGLSRSQLFRVFIKNSGVSPQRALMLLRLKQAESLLKNSGLPLKAVALSCGFASAARMGDVFKQEKGITPMQFRNMG